jgi:hypothetical protein
MAPPAHRTKELWQRVRGHLLHDHRAEYGTSGSKGCNSSLGNKITSLCFFYDVTAGDNDSVCTGTENCYRPSGKYGVLSTSDSTYDPAFPATTGYDLPTGLGTISAYNLV